MALTDKCYIGAGDNVLTPYRVLKRACQSPNGFENTTVAVLPPLEPVTDLRRVGGARKQDHRAGPALRVGWAGRRVTAAHRALTGRGHHTACHFPDPGRLTGPPSWLAVHGRLRAARGWAWRECGGDQRQGSRRDGRPTGALHCPGTRQPPTPPWPSALRS